MPPKKRTTKTIVAGHHRHKQPKTKKATVSHSKEGSPTLFNHNNTFSDVLSLVVVKGFLKLVDLQTLLNTSKAVSSMVRHSKVWGLHFLPSSKVRVNPLGLPPPYGRIDRSKWEDPSAPRGWDVTELEIPPRQRASTNDRPDRNTYYPHPSDIAATGHVLAESAGVYPPGLHRFNKETGALEDLFYAADEDAAAVFFRTQVWIPRPLPIACCGQSFTSYAGLVDHFCTLEHNLSAIPANRRIPEDLWDPRNRPDYSDKLPWEKVQACLQYKRKILNVLRAPMDARGMENMQNIYRWVRDFYGEADSITLESVTEACVGFVVSDFLEEGMVPHGYACDVILGGWRRFGFHGSGSSENFLLSFLVPGQYHHG